MGFWGGERGAKLACNEISIEPLQIIAVDPVNEGKETVGPATDARTSRGDMANPFKSGGLLLHIGITCRD